jgi:hypothetical protein
MIACISVWLAIRHGRRVTSNVLTLPYVSPQVLQAAIEYYEQSGWRKQFEGEGLRAVVNTSHN